MVKGIQFKCLLKVWQNGGGLVLAGRQDLVCGSILTEEYTQLRHLRNGRGCLMFTPQASMKMMPMEITIGNFGNGSSDILKVFVLKLLSREYPDNTEY